MPPLTTQIFMLLQRASTLVRGSGAQTATIPSTPSWRRCWSCSQSSTRRLCASLLQWPAARWLLVTPLCRALLLAQFVVLIPGACSALHKPSGTQVPDAATLRHAHTSGSSHEEQLDAQLNQPDMGHISSRAAALLGPAGPVKGAHYRNGPRPMKCLLPQRCHTIVAEAGQMGCRVVAVAAG